MSAEGESSPNHAVVPTEFCEDGRPSGRKRSKRSADPPRRSNSKRARENTPSDDDLSLHAQDDLDDEDLKLLTEQSSATGQARETPVPEAKILQDIANGFEDDDATGGKIMQQLADIATKRQGKKLSSDKLKNLLDKYKRPEIVKTSKPQRSTPKYGINLILIKGKLISSCLICNK